jgi:hypothetical protein
MKTPALAETDTHLQNFVGCDNLSILQRYPLSRAPAEGRADAYHMPCVAAVSQPLSPSRRTRRVTDDPASAEPAASGSAGSAAHPIAAVPGDEYGDRDGPPLALQNKWKPSYVDTGNRRNFLRELPAGPAVVPPINGGVCADGRRTF